jgi:diguanylate cyclase (GGDEF)-like protein/PAS domain S-box-containing protein
VTERADRVAFAPVSRPKKSGEVAVAGLNGGNGSPKPVVQLDPAFPLPSSPALICDRQGIIRQANLALARLAGLTSPDELVGVRVKRFIFGADEDAALVWRSGGPVSRVKVVRCPLAPAPDGSELQLVVVVDVTEIQHAVHALAVERRRVAEVERVAGLGSWEFDPRTGETLWSDGHYQLLGIEPGTVVPGADAVLDIIHPDDRDYVAAYWAEHMITGTPIDIEYRVRRSDGEVRVVQGLAQAKRDNSGRMVRYTGSIRDITEQRHAERALATERARLLEAQRISRMGSWSYELTTMRYEFSAALVEMVAELGVDPYTDPLACVHPDDQPRLTQLVLELGEVPADQTIEVEFRGPPGTNRTFLVRARAEHNESAEIVRVLGTVQDVTEQRAMQEQLRVERRRLADAQRVARTGTWEWDPRAVHMVWSDMLYELFAVPAGEVMSFRCYLNMVHPDDRELVHQQWTAMSAQHQSVEFEHRAVRRDGLERVFRVYGAGVTTPDGATRFVGTAQDVTEQRAAETRILRSSQRFTDLLAIAPVGIGLFDDNQRLVNANDALCRLLGYPLDQLRGQMFARLTNPENSPDPLPPPTDLLAGGENSYTVPQVELLRSDGGRVSCELHISVSVQDDGQRFWLVVFSDITERLRAAEVLRYQATHDDLTGLPNRSAVKQLIGELLAGPTRQQVAVLFCDIDNFKRVNDSLGHDAGDELLVALARRLADGLPPSCTAARLSGDEYLVICHDTTQAGGVNQLVDTVSKLLRAAIPLRGQIVQVSATVGAAMPNCAHTSPEDLLRFADAAMYQAKDTGRGRVALASAALIASADGQVELEGQLRDALATDELVLNYQPVVGPDGNVRTAEALVRWPHRDRGLLPPKVFLPVAEQGDLLRELDRWVLRTALREAVGWSACSDRKISVAVNLAGLVPGDVDFVDVVATAVAESGIEWDQVVLELVETALVDLPSRARKSMAELVDRGVRFAVDDFGTGYSSLARLRELPAQILKVDRQFVSRVGTDPLDFAIARAVVDMARAMGRTCVAEGVEEPTQFHVLRGLGVDAYQGFLFSRPISAQEFRTVLTQGPLHVPRKG